MCPQRKRKSQELRCNKLLPRAKGLDPNHESLNVTNMGQDLTIADFDGQEGAKKQGSVKVK
jgi:hypothetical protein